MPLTGIKADSSTYLPWFEYMGDRGETFDRVPVLFDK